MWEIVLDKKTGGPCTNTECDYYDQADPDGLNCHIFDPPNENQCDDYMTAEKIN